MKGCWLAYLLAARWYILPMRCAATVPEDRVEPLERDRGTLTLAA